MDISFKRECTNCGYVPDPSCGDDPNVYSDKLTLCAECISDFAQALTAYRVENPAPRTLYGQSVVYREMH